MSDSFSPRPIRILIVDDSAFMRTALSRIIGTDPGMLVVGTAANGSEALSKIPACNPDVITLDLEMPGLNGLDTLRCIMADFPRPVIMVSSVTEHNSENTFLALAIGAFDCIPKQLSSDSLDIIHIHQDLLTKIRAAAASVPTHAAQHSIARKPSQSSTADTLPSSTSSDPLIVAIAVSTGGPRALQEILPRLPRDLPVPILIVQHMPPGFTGPFAQRLNTMCALTVCEAVHHETVRPGVVYIAPAGMHMTVERISESKTWISLDRHPENYLHIPSADVLMKSVADQFKNRSVGIVMTGMGSDGTQGMKAIYSQGGFTIGQDEASSTVYSMPRTCAELGILRRVVPLLQIPSAILRATRYRKRA